MISGRGMTSRFEKFSKRARWVLVLAQEEAKHMNHSYIHTEHMLLALVREDEGVASKVLTNLGVTPSKLCSAIESMMGRGEKPISGEIGIAPNANRVIELAIDEARQLGHDHIGSEHLLLGLLREEERAAAERTEFFKGKGKDWERFATTTNYGILHSFGVTYEQARTETNKLLSMPPHG